MATTGRKGEGAGGTAAPSGTPTPSEQTPSGVIRRDRDPRRRGDSDPPSFRSLTPYQARLDVEMDDTAVSKVRDPSVSISLGAEQAVSPGPHPHAHPRQLSRDALSSVILGTLLGALLVVALALVVRLVTQ